MKVTFLRHGTRHFTLGDVPLNEKGIQQALELSLLSEFKEIKTILASPKKRAQMTVVPLAEKLKLNIKTVENLDQMKSGESEEEFTLRVQSVIDKIQKNSWDTPLLLCSHSDWLIKLLQIIPTDELDLNFYTFDCAEFITFEFKDQLWVKK